jgi:hypothetical protein
MLSRVQRSVIHVGITVLVLSLLAACGRDEPDAIASKDARSLLENRNWLDRWPRSKDERLHVLRFTPSMGGGVYQDRTLFRGQFELFTYKVDGPKIIFLFPDTGERVASRFEIRPVDGPEPFDLQLTLDPAPRGPRVLFGRRAETGDTGALRLPVEAAAGAGEP